MVDPIRRSGNRGNAPNRPPYKYNDDLWLKYLSEPLGNDLEVRMMRLEVDITAGPLFGPFTIPAVPGDKAIIAAFAQPFEWGDMTNTNPTTLDVGVVRPAFAIRDRNTLELLLAPVADIRTAASGLAINTGLTPLVEQGDGLRIPGDFHTDFGIGASNTDNSRPAIVMNLRDDGATPGGATGDNDYTITYNSGVSRKVTVLSGGTVPVVGQEWPIGQEATRFDYLDGQVQREQDRVYPKRNLRNTLDISDVADGNQGVEENPHAISAVRTVTPEGTTVPVKRVTLVDGSTTSVPTTTATVIGEEIGDPTSTGFIQDVHDVHDWAAFDVFLVLAPDMADGAVGGNAVDPWDMWGAPT